MISAGFLGILRYIVGLAAVVADGEARLECFLSGMTCFSFLGSSFDGILGLGVHPKSLRALAILALLQRIDLLSRDQKLLARCAWITESVE